jgi:cytochrome c-type biogenesis protein CcmH/NrfG
VPRESLLFGVAGVFFGILVGWIIGTQQGAGAAPQPVPQQQAASSDIPGQTVVPLDESRANELRATAEKNAGDAPTRVQLGNMYFDAGRYQDAAKWYEEALRITPANADVSTDLGITYYYTNQPDRALAQFDRSLAIDPKHSKTLLNIGVVRAFGKQDLAGAAKAWQQVLDMAPDTPEARAARQALEGLKNAHPEASGSGSASGGQPD